MTLTDFLLARIAEDEDRAKRAAFGWGATWSVVTDEFEDWSTVHADGKRDMVGCEDGDVTEHIARHDPSRVLAECEAKRRIIVGLDYESDEWCFADAPAVAEVLPFLALPYADHPDYQQEWKP